MSVAAYVFSLNQQLVYGAGATVQLGVLRACNRPVIEYAIAALRSIDDLKQVYIIVSPNHVQEMATIAEPLSQMYQLNINVISIDIKEQFDIHHQQLFQECLKSFDFTKIQAGQAKSIVLNLNNFFHYDFKEQLRAGKYRGISCAILPKQQSNVGSPERYTYIDIQQDGTSVFVQNAAKWIPDMQTYEHIDLQCYTFDHFIFPIQKMQGFNIVNHIQEYCGKNNTSNYTIDQQNFSQDKQYYCMDSQFDQKLIKDQQFNYQSFKQPNFKSNSAAGQIPYINIVRPAAIRYRGLYTDISQLLELFTLNTLILRMTTWNVNCISSDVIVGSQSVLECCSVGSGAAVGERCRLLECVLEDGVEIGDGVRAKRCYISKGGRIEPYGVYENFFMGQ